jgi:hypothetical protein
LTLKGQGGHGIAHRVLRTDRPDKTDKTSDRNRARRGDGDAEEAQRGAGYDISTEGRPILKGQGGHGIAHGAARAHTSAATVARGKLTTKSLASQLVSMEAERRASRGSATRRTSDGLFMQP